MDVTRISAATLAAEAAPGSPGGAALEAAEAFARTLAQAEAQSRAAVTTGTDPHDLVAAIAESRLAVEAVTAVRDKVVEAYQEILRMPV